MSSPEILAVIVCDDIRKEITGKDILVGVYSGDILVRSFPAVINVGFWISLVPANTGEQNLAFRIALTGKPPVEMKLSGHAVEVTETALALPRLEIQVEEPSELTLEMLDNGEWKTIRSKPVRMGKSRSISPPAAGS